MDTISVINATKANEYAFMPFAGGPSSFQRVLKLARTVSGEGRVLVLAGPDCPPETGGIVAAEGWTMKSVLDQAAAFAAANPEAAAMILFQADAPFSDRELTDRLLDLHRRYRAEYTFADGYPPGFAPEIVSVRSLPNLARLASDHDAPSDRAGLFAVLQKDINSYDIETELSPVDLRSLRLEPVCDCRRNKAVAERLWAAGARTAADAVSVIPGKPALLRTLPAFLWVQVAAACPQACSYCPYPAMVGDPRTLSGTMPLDRFARLMDEAETLCDDIVVDLSPWGDPVSHPGIEELAALALSHRRFTLLLETAGVGWDDGIVERMVAAGRGRLHWIVSLDEPDGKAYAALRGDGFEEATAFASRLVALAPDNAHVQAVRMKSNEERLEAFYRGWKKSTEKVIIQKYDAYAGTLPALQVADLSPLDRHPCRHLARDMTVLLDGTVPMCRDCLVKGDSGRLEYAETVGDVFDIGLEEAWNRMGAWFDRHCDGRYPEPCGRCDEYHTFNA